MTKKQVMRAVVLSYVARRSSLTKLLIALHRQVFTSLTKCRQKLSNDFFGWFSLHSTVENNTFFGVPFTLTMIINLLPKCQNYIVISRKCDNL